ncbi:hypothetical protein HMPREF1141_0551 [Clostridium sp. MSTE9]|uniref:hypothetical protein n=1 Tax=Clostridium sp. (strain MSTE9) TaxID=1105031 RepID=UPI00026F2432|nr:hypothetical protein [Clostridium sp. MSTE9]EJF39198.1 hypothetical protein HMPREF1141_0551 [Clostridium sp. MSTE9]
MQFNFDVFSALATKAYQAADSPSYSLGEVISVFEYYFRKYEETFGKPHPHIRQEQIQRMIEDMPFVTGEYGNPIDIEPEDYFPMIDRHFQTQYRCDYNINHFFSGDIRLYRYYEMM